MLIAQCQWEKGQSLSRFDLLNTTVKAREVPRYSRFFHIAGDELTHFVKTHFRVIAERRATALSLACQLYRADHSGWPQRLDQLVPIYINSLPVDPFDSGARPFGYQILKSPVESS